VEDRAISVLDVQTVDSQSLTGIPRTSVGKLLQNFLNIWQARVTWEFIPLVTAVDIAHILNRARPNGNMAHKKSDFK
jgi:hypothetical protein